MQIVESKEFWFANVRMNPYSYPRERHHCNNQKRLRPAGHDAYGICPTCEGQTGLVDAYGKAAFFVVI